MDSSVRSTQHPATFFSLAEGFDPLVNALSRLRFQTKDVTFERCSGFE